VRRPPPLGKRLAAPVLAQVFARKQKARGRVQ